MFNVLIVFISKNNNFAFCLIIMINKAYLTIYFLLITIFQLTAQENIVEMRTYNTSRIIGEPPVIDGYMNDSVWNLVNWSGDFIQQRPYEFKKPSQKTRFKILYNDNNLYVLIRAFDTEPEKIEKRLTRRDGFAGDWVAISIDSYNDDKTGFNFFVTAAGVKADVINTNDGYEDDTWDPVWYTKVSSDDEGWLAEIRIPFTQLRFAKIKNHTWGLEVMRQLFRKQELSLWQMIPRDAPGWVSNWGTLKGIDNINPKKEIELIPYVMGSLEKGEKVEGNPFARGTHWGYNAGLDGKIAITNDFTLNFTINPDFGQVESDPSEVNLSAFESFFEEKRPFFVEGSNIFEFPLMGSGNRTNLFYSRRIGRRPHYYPDLYENEYVDMPEFTRILGAFKLSGKTKNGWSIGIMESVTNREFALIDSAGTSRKETVEPTTNFFNIRIQKDINDGNTIVGGMFTATNRFTKDEHLNFLPDKAYTGGIDFKQYWSDKKYYFAAKGFGSSIYGDSTSIIDLQRAPQRYYQRPDMEHRNIDSTLTSFSGYGGNVEAGKVGGGNWRYGFRAWWLSPAIDVNDMGYITRSDAISQSIWAEYIIYNPFSIFRNMNFSFSQWSWWDFSGRYLNLGTRVSTNAQFINYWGYSFGIMRNQKDVNRSELRGGPSLVFPDSWKTWLSIETDSRKKIYFDIYGSIELGNNNEKLHQDIGIGITYQPTNALKLTLNPGYYVDYDRIRYVTTIEESTNNTYVVGSLIRNVTSMDIRISYSLTPDLSLQYWGQPFFYSADYSRFADVVDAGNFTIQDQYYVYNSNEIQYDDIEDLYEVNTDGGQSFEFENPDFSVFEFRSNFVLRWEYIPGSSAYFVWSQGRAGDAPTGNFSFDEHVSNLIDVNPTNIFLLKISYRLSF